MFPFRLYGLQNCGFCQQAEAFLRANSLPADVILADGDPIITKGIQALAGKADFPVLLSRWTNEVITGWKQGEYERLRNAFVVLTRTGSLNVSVDGKPPEPETPAAPAELATATS